MLPYLVVPLISARVPLISTRVSAHCQAILLILLQLCQISCSHLGYPNQSFFVKASKSLIEPFMNKALITQPCIYINMNKWDCSVAHRSRVIGCSLSVARRLAILDNSWQVNRLCSSCSYSWRVRWHSQCHVSYGVVFYCMNSICHVWLFTMHVSRCNWWCQPIDAYVLYCSTRVGIKPNVYLMMKHKMASFTTMAMVAVSPKGCCFSNLILCSMSYPYIRGKYPSGWME